MTNRFRVFGSLDKGGGAKAGTVEIDRDAGTFSVRPLRSRRQYTVALSLVADIIVEKIIKAELREKQAEKKKKLAEKKKRKGVVRMNK